MLYSDPCGFYSFANMASRIQQLINFLSKTSDEFKQLVAFGIKSKWIEREGSYRAFIESKGYLSESAFVKGFEYYEPHVSPLPRSYNWMFTCYPDAGKKAGDLVKLRVISIVWQKTNLRYRFQEVEVFYPSDDEKYNVDGFLRVLWPALEEDAKNITILSTKMALENDSSIEKRPEYLYSRDMDYRELFEILNDGQSSSPGRGIKTATLNPTLREGDERITYFVRKTPDKSLIDNAAAKAKVALKRATRQRPKRLNLEKRNFAAAFTQTDKLKTTRNAKIQVDLIGKLRDFL